MSCPPDLSRLAAALERTDHALPCEDWAALLLLADPAEYADLPLPPPGRIPFSDQARVAFYQIRARRKLSLFHPADRHQDGEDLHLACGASRLRNGAVSHNQPIVGGARCPPAP